jgi:hypothetical protein
MSQHSPAQAAFLASCFALNLSTLGTKARGTGDLTYRAGNGAPWSTGRQRRRPIYWLVPVDLFSSLF